MNAGVGVVRVGVVRVGVVRVIINLHRMFEGTIWDTFQVPKFKPKPDTCRNMSCTVDDFT